MWAEETSTYSWSRFCTVKQPTSEWEASVLPLHHRGPIRTSDFITLNRMRENGTEVLTILQKKKKKKKKKN